MTDDFQLARGIRVPDLTGVHEGYATAVSDKGTTVFTLNVSAERMAAVFQRLASEVVEMGFLVLEVGTHESVEKTLRTSPSDPFHKDVFYFDGLTESRLRDILDRFGELFVHDGGIHFGFGSHTGTDEVFVSAYKVFYIYADAPDKYVRALDELGFQREETLKTVWDNFTQDAPGSRHVLTDETPTIWDVIETLKGEGLYFAERREC